MFVRSFNYRAMDEDKGGEGQGGASGSAGGNDEVVDLTISGASHKVPKAVAQAFGTLNKSLRTMESDLKILKETASNAKGAEYQELLTKIQELEYEKLPEKEREAARLSGELAKLKGLHEVESKNSARYKGLFYENAISTALNSALSGHDLYDTEQTLQLLKAFGQPKLTEDANGAIKIVLSMDLDGNGVQEYEPKEGAAKWLGLSKNANLLKNNLQPGAGTSVKGALSQPGGGLAFKRTDLQDPAIRQQYQAALKQGKDVTII
ncbi:hypothetical protein LEP1GSC166_1897 [Leptospira kirschneri]|uniref:hypothetical protein n=1 Tax=Leptospira kirschneri TaxID=29507 RepID=UPI0002BFB0DE|nr:hypothetical protein [Leptospira kirschneri]EMK02834.1 hypothetical protein LEP1GSC166_1897 [Leptospira kirschneri]